MTTELNQASIGHPGNWNRLAEIISIRLYARCQVPYVVRRCAGAWNWVQGIQVGQRDFGDPRSGLSHPTD